MGECSENDQTKVLEICMGENMQEATTQYSEFNSYFNKEDFEVLFVELEKELTSPKPQNLTERRSFLQKTFRAVHTLKGTAGMLHLHDAAKTLHILESVLQQLVECTDRIIEIKNDRIFDFFLSGLDIIDQINEAIREGVDFELKNRPDLQKKYEVFDANASQIINNIDDYLNLEKLNLEAF